MSVAGTPPSVAEQALCVSAAQFVNGRKPDGAAENKQRLPLSFSGQKAFAWAEGNHRFCPHKHCRKSGKCKGGPRGTFRKFGRPFCKLETIAHQIQYRAKQAEMRKREREISDWL